MKTAILAGELTVDDAEGIGRIRSSVQLVPISEARVLSDEEEERTAFEQQRLVTKWHHGLCFYVQLYAVFTMFHL